MIDPEQVEVSVATVRNFLDGNVEDAIEDAFDKAQGDVYSGQAPYALITFLIVP